MSRKTIRFEDLGEPVQRLLKSLKGGVSEEDMALLEYVGVKDMKTIYEEMASEQHAAEIWLKLREALQVRKEKAEKKENELSKREMDLEQQRAEQEKAEEEERIRQEEEEQARLLAKEERRKKRADARLEAEELEKEAAEEAERLAQEEAENKRREAKRKKREIRARELEEEAEQLRLEQERAKKSKKKNQKEEWANFVASHPLDFAPEQEEIKQVCSEPSRQEIKVADEELLNRSWTPKCPNCNAKFSRPPDEWICPICFRRSGVQHKVWQPDQDSKACMCCKRPIIRFNRHHCRNCGRLVCGKCSDYKAIIPSIGYDNEVKICNSCAEQHSPQ
eukprot:Tbor_TRINITY_DN5132_c0_g1::TRINITY_DN5132_c0_g1_i1::g.26307::m.26307